jgi:hypothetical protein
LFLARKNKYKAFLLDIIAKCPSVFRIAKKNKKNHKKKKKQQQQQQQQ